MYSSNLLHKAKTSKHEHKNMFASGEGGKVTSRKSGKEHGQGPCDKISHTRLDMPLKTFRLTSLFLECCIPPFTEGIA